jgi:hypothetical protein
MSTGTSQVKVGRLGHGRGLGGSERLCSLLFHENPRTVDSSGAGVRGDTTMLRLRW